MFRYSIFSPSLTRWWWPYDTVCAVLCELVYRLVRTCLTDVEPVVLFLFTHSNSVEVILLRFRSSNRAPEDFSLSLYCWFFFLCWTSDLASDVRVILIAKNSNCQCFLPVYVVVPKKVFSGYFTMVTRVSSNSSTVILLRYKMKIMMKCSQ